MVVAPHLVEGVIGADAQFQRLAFDDGELLGHRHIVAESAGLGDVVARPGAIAGRVDLRHRQGARIEEHRLLGEARFPVMPRRGVTSGVPMNVVGMVMLVPGVRLLDAERRRDGQTAEEGEMMRKLPSVHGRPRDDVMPAQPVRSERRAAGKGNSSED